MNTPNFLPQFKISHRINQRQVITAKNVHPGSCRAPTTAKQNFPSVSKRVKSKLLLTPENIPAETASSEIRHR